MSAVQCKCLVCAGKQSLGWLEQVDETHVMLDGQLSQGIGIHFQIEIFLLAGGQVRIALSTFERDR